MRISDWSSDVCSSDLRPDRLEADGGTRRSRDRVGPRNDDRGRTVDWNVAVVNAKRRRNHARIEIFVERDRLAVNRVRIERGIFALVACEHRQLFSLEAGLSLVEERKSAV